MKKIGFTGTPMGMTVRQKERFTALIRAEADVAEFHHGDCVGADEEAHNVVVHLPTKVKIVIHPPSNGRRAFRVGDEIRPLQEHLVRNRDIVDDSTALYATPSEFKEKTRSGTWAMVRHARSIGCRVVLVFPDGSSRVEEAAVPREPEDLLLD